MKVKNLVLIITVAFGSHAWAADNGFKEGSADASGVVTGSAGVDGEKMPRRTWKNIQSH